MDDAQPQASGSPTEANGTTGDIPQTPINLGVDEKEELVKHGMGIKKSKRRQKNKAKNSMGWETDQSDPEFQNIVKTFGTNYWGLEYPEDGPIDNDETMDSRQDNLEFAKGKEVDIDTIIPTEEFHSAAALGEVKEVIAMIKRGKGVMSVDGEGTTAMHHAARHGQMGVVQLLLNNGGDINAADSVRKTPLYWAAKEGRAASVRKLLDLGAEIESKTVTGWTALHTAARDGKPRVVEVLLEFNCEVNTRSHFGVTPFYLGELNREYDCLRLLLKAGANPLLKTIEGVSPIDNAIHDDDPSRLQDLLKVILPGLRDESYQDMCICLYIEDEEFQINTLRSAVENGNVDLTRLFMKLEVDLEKPDENGNTLLHIATMKGNVKIVELLLDYGANVQAKSNRTSRTALHIAANLAGVEDSDFFAQQGKDLVTLLLKWGAYFGARDAFGLSPLQLAQRVKDQNRTATNILLNPPAVEGRTGFEEPMPPATKLSDNESQVCEAFNVFLVDFDSPPPKIEKPAHNPNGIEGSQAKSSRRKGRGNSRRKTVVDAPTHRVDWLPRTKTVHEVVYSLGPQKIMEEARQNMPTKTNHLFRWIHVPANNIVWVKDLVHKICHEKGFKKGHFEEMANFVSMTATEHQGASVEFRHMKTCFTLQENETREGRNPGESAEEPKLAIFMPFLTFNTTASQREITDTVRSFASWQKKKLAGAEAAKQSKKAAREREVHEKEAVAIRLFRDTTDNVAHAGQVKCKESHDSFRGRRKLFLVSDLEDQTPPRIPTVSERKFWRRKGPGSSSQDVLDLRELESNDLSTSHITTQSAKPPLSIQERYKMLIREYLGHPHGPIHISRTLDSCYYNSIGTVTRDSDQVIYRFSRLYTNVEEVTLAPQTRLSAEELSIIDIHSSGEARVHTRHHDSTSGALPTVSKQIGTGPEAVAYSGNPRIFTVDQMWVWIIDEETIISSFPQRWGEEAREEPKVLETIQAHLSDKNRPQVKSVYEMAALITSYCIRFVDQCSVKGDVMGTHFEESFMQIYGSAVSNEVERGARLIKKFNDQTFAAKDKALDLDSTDDDIPNESITSKKNTRRRQREFKENRDITGEIGVLGEIKDIRQELSVLHRIFEEQKSIAEKLFSPTNHLRMSRAVQHFYFEQSGLERRIEDVIKMDQAAHLTYQLTEHSLDLKLKQANIDQVVAGVDQGHIAVEQAKITADQGAVVLVFTLVTIIFLPMSFLTSLYALNISSFPHDAKGDLAYPSNYLFSRLFGISTAIATILITLAFQVRRLRNVELSPLLKLKEKNSTVLSLIALPPVFQFRGNKVKLVPREEQEVSRTDSFPLGFRDISPGRDGSITREREAGSSLGVIIGDEVSENQGDSKAGAVKGWTRKVWGKRARLSDDVES